MQAVMRASYTQIAKYFQRTVWARQHKNKGNVKYVTNEKITWFTGKCVQNAYFFFTILRVCAKQKQK